MELNNAGGKRAGTVPTALRAAMAVAAIVLVAAFFLPWASAGEEYREAAAQLPDIMVYEPLGMTAADAEDLSLLEYAQVYGSMAQTSPAWGIYAAIVYAGLAAAALALVLGALGKPIGAAVFAVLTLGISRVLIWDFTDRGVLPNSTHTWGVAPAVLLAAAMCLIVLAVATVVLRRRANHAPAGQ